MAQVRLSILGRWVPELLDLDQQTVVTIGRQLLEQDGTLVVDVCELDEIGQDYAASLPQIQARNIDQWRARDVVVVDGWMITRQEATLARCYVQALDSAG